MDEMKLVAASNIIKLRTDAGMTQAELGERLSYSDKSISKWERGDALPDAYVLKQMAGIFGVTVDYLLTEHDAWESEQDKRRAGERTYSARVVTLVSVAGIWTLAVLVFVVLWILGRVEWLVFGATIPATLITLLVFNCVWRKGHGNEYIIAILVASLIAFVYFSIRRASGSNPWQIFLVLIPAELVVFLSSRIMIKKH